MASEIHWDLYINPTAVPVIKALLKVNADGTRPHSNLSEVASVVFSDELSTISDPHDREKKLKSKTSYVSRLRANARGLITKGQSLPIDSLPASHRQIREAIAGDPRLVNMTRDQLLDWLNLRTKSLPPLTPAPDASLSASIVTVAINSVPNLHYQTDSSSNAPPRNNGPIPPYPPEISASISCHELPDISKLRHQNLAWAFIRLRDDGSFEIPTKDEIRDSVYGFVLDRFTDDPETARRVASDYFEIDTTYIRAIVTRALTKELGSLPFNLRYLIAYIRSRYPKDAVKSGTLNQIFSRTSTAFEVLGNNSEPRTPKSEIMNTHDRIPYLVWPRQVNLARRLLDIDPNTNTLKYPTTLAAARVAYAYLYRRSGNPEEIFNEVAETFLPRDLSNIVQVVEAGLENGSKRLDFRTKDLLDRIIARFGRGLIMKIITRDAIVIQQLFPDSQNGHSNLSAPTPPLPDLVPPSPAEAPISSPRFDKTRVEFLTPAAQRKVINPSEVRLTHPEIYAVARILLDSPNSLLRELGIHLDQQSRLELDTICKRTIHSRKALGDESTRSNLLANIKAIVKNAQEAALANSNPLARPIFPIFENAHSDTPTRLLARGLSLV